MADADPPHHGRAPHPLLRIVSGMPHLPLLAATALASGSIAR
jgi:hypothetical protein